MLTDTHTHLHDPQFEKDLPEVLARAREGGVERMLTIGTDLESSRRAVELAGRHDFLYAAVGVHPHEVKDLREEDYTSLVELAGHPKVVAYGEIGLDYHYMHSPQDLQQQHFRRQVRLGRDLGLPLVIHTRQAPEKTLEILKEEGAEQVGGVFHCFTEGPAVAQAALSLGFFISFSGILTFPKAVQLHEAAREVPPERLLVETDCPYLAPIPYRGKRNEPAHVRHVAEQLSRLKSIPLEEIARQTSENARRLFKKIDS